MSTVSVPPDVKAVLAPEAEDVMGRDYARTIDPSAVLRVERVPGTASPDDHADDVPAHARLAAEIRARIESGELAPGQELPSENETAAYGVSRQTVRRAMTSLRASGLVVTRQGRPTTVRATLGVLPVDALDIDVTLPADGTSPQTWTPDVWRTLHQSYRLGDVATYKQMLKMAPSERTFVMSRTLAHPSGVHVIQRIHVPLATAAEAKELGNKSFTSPVELYATLTAAGHQLHWHDTITTTMPTARDAERLDVPEGVALLVHFRVTTDQNDRPLMLEESRVPGDRATFANRPTRYAPQQASTL